MRTVGGPAAVIAILGLFICCSVGEAALPYYLKEQISYTVKPESRFFVVDVDLDGNDDILLVDDFQIIRYRIYGFTLTLKDSASYKKKGHVSNVCDATGDGRPEFLVSIELPHGIVVACHDWFAKGGPSNPIYELGPFLSKQQTTRSWPRGAVYALDCFDADRNGRQELYLGVIPYYAKPYPRSLRAYDGLTGKELWHYDMGPQVKDLRLLPLPPDSALIIASTFAPANQSVWNGTSDDSSYVFCFDAQGRIKWRTMVTGPGSWSNIELADGNADGIKEIYVARKFGDAEMRTGELDRWCVAMLDRTTGRIRYESDLGAGAEDIYAANLDQDQNPEILVSTSDGRFFILNGDLSTRESSSDNRQKGGGDPCIFSVLDLNGDGTKEIGCGGATSVLIRNGRGEIIAEQDIGGAVFAAVARVEDRRFIVAKGAGKDTIRLFTLEKSLALAADSIAPASTRTKQPERSPKARSIGFLIIGAAVGIVCSLGAMIFQRQMKRRESRLALADEAQDALLIAMSAFGHGGSSLKVLDRLRFHLKNWERMRGGAAPAQDSFAMLVDTFGESVLPDLRHLVFLARKADVPPQHWKSVVQLAMDAKKAIDQLRVATSRTFSEHEMKPVGNALARLDELDRNVSGIRDHLHGVFRTSIVPSLGKVLSGRLEGMKTIGVEPKLNVMGSYDDSAFISPTVFDKVFDGLLINAIAAMKGSDSRTLDITVRNEGANCLVDVRDAGCGIAREDWERVFERHYTTKPAEGGFGLFYSREELAKFSGKIYVLESSRGAGTTIRVVLRRAS
jgi:hypothetical protein